MHTAEVLAMVESIVGGYSHPERTFSPCHQFLKGESTTAMPIEGLSNETLPDQATVATQPTVAAVIITRNRPAMLRRTLSSLKLSVYPLSSIIVADDSSSDETAVMLSAEFPEVLRVEGPRRGIAANRNRGMSVARSDYILLSDDDMMIDPGFVLLALQQVSRNGAGLIFAPIDDKGKKIYPNNFGLLGFSNKPYPLGAPYQTANQQCFVVSRELTLNISYDEVIDIYGYEEMDFAYRVAAAGVGIACVSSCCNIHLDPYSGPPRHEKDAARLYVTLKRIAYVDRNFFGSFRFLVVALPHHILACIRRSGLRGIAQAFSHFRLAAKMLMRFRREGGIQGIPALGFRAAPSSPPRKAL